MAKKRTRAMKIRGLRRPARRHLKRLLKGLSARRLKKRRHTRRRGENPLTRAETTHLLREGRSWARGAVLERKPSDKMYYRGRAAEAFSAAHKFGPARMRHVRSVVTLPAELLGARLPHGRMPAKWWTAKPFGRRRGPTHTSRS